MKKCHDCGIQEGQIHKLGCSMEYCPECGRQLISCYKHCIYPSGNFRPSIYEAKRVPYFSPPLRCYSCGEKTGLWMVDDEVWEAVTPRDMHDEVLCKKCFKRIYNIRSKQGTLFEDVSLPRGF